MRGRSLRGGACLWRHQTTGPAAAVLASLNPDATELVPSAPPGQIRKEEERCVVCRAAGCEEVAARLRQGAVGPRIARRSGMEHAAWSAQDGAALPGFFRRTFRRFDGAESGAARSGSQRHGVATSRASLCPLRVNAKTHNAPHRSALANEMTPRGSEPDAVFPKDFAVWVSLRRTFRRTCGRVPRAAAGCARVRGQHRGFAARCLPLEVFGPESARDLTPPVHAAGVRHGQASGHPFSRAQRG